MPPIVPVRFLLEEPRSFLRLFSSGVPSTFDLDGVEVAQAWALVGLAALARRNGSSAMQISMHGAGGASRFAHAIGLRDAIDGVPSTVLGERGRTYKIRRVAQMGEIEKAAQSIAELMLPNTDDDDSQQTIRYVLIELMRNAIQHSHDAKGGVVAAQLMRAGHSGYASDVIQVAVADSGIGVLESLQATHPTLGDPIAAIVQSLEPHVSGAFGPGLTGTKYNAGMGLFFISQMAKRLLGRLLIASKGGAVLLKGGEDGVSTYQQTDLPGFDFPGTLVAFELPLGEVQDHAALIEVIRKTADERTPQRDTTPWVRFEAPPLNAQTFVVHMLAEDVVAAEGLSREQLQPRIFKHEPVALDFRNVSMCTQSFAHALLYQAIRIAWAVQSPIYIQNARPAVESAIRLVDNYARGG